MQNLNEKQQAVSQQGLVISYFGNSVAVEADDGQVFQCQLHRNQDLPVVGDRVDWHMGSGDTGEITAILPRKSLLLRGDARGKSKPIAANVDLMMVVMSPPPVFAEYLLDRYLVAAELLHIKPVIVVNKADLLTEESRAAVLERLAPYSRIPCAVVLSSICAPGGLDGLAAELKGNTAVLVGPSGVGKSSIITAFGCMEPIKVSEVSPKGAGKHTTTATRLYHLPQGGCLIDSPGLRDFALWEIGKPEVLQGFREFQPYLNQCRFRDCQHMQEPDCKVREAVASGEISNQRWQSYCDLMNEAHKIKKQY